jgi:hypothetical protein
MLGEEGSVRRGVVMVKQPGLFSPKFGATSSYIFTRSPENVAVELGIQSLACWNRFFALLQLLYRWRHQYEIFWIQPGIVNVRLQNIIYNQQNNCLLIKTPVKR